MHARTDGRTQERKKDKTHGHSEPHKLIQLMQEKHNDEVKSARKKRQVNGASNNLLTYYIMSRSHRANSTQLNWTRFFPDFVQLSSVSLMRYSRAANTTLSTRTTVPVPHVPEQLSHAHAELGQRFWDRR